MVKKIIIITMLIIAIFSLNSFADDSEYVNIGLSFNNPEYNTGTILGDKMYLELNGKTFNLNTNSLNFKLDDSYRVQIGLSYNTYEEFIIVYNTAKANDSTVIASFGDSYKIYSKEFSTFALAENYKNSMSNVFNVELETKKIANKIFLYNGSINILIESYDVLLKHGGITFSYNDKRYREDVKFYVYGGDISVINHLTIKNYLYGVVPREMSNTWPLEALKAQAIISRTYLLKNIGTFRVHGFDLGNTSSSQVYGGYDYEGVLSNKSVDETNGKIVTYNGVAIYSYYHSNSGGYTANSENVWSTSLPYLKGVYDFYSIGAPNTTWTLNYTENQMIEALNNYGYNINSVDDMYTSEIASDGRVQKLVIVSNGNKIVLEKELVRKIFGYSTFKSIFYTVSVGNNYSVITDENTTSVQLSGLNVISSQGISELTIKQDINIKGSNYTKVIYSEDIFFTFDGHGWGHGIGLSQWGAKKMAEEGFTYEQIIKFYYKGVEIG